MTPFPSVIDSSLISAFRSCPYKARLEFLEHWKPRTPSVHLHAGAAFARGLEIARKAFYVDQRPVDEAIALGCEALAQAYGTFECPSDSAKSFERMVGALVFYFDSWPFTSETAPPSILPGNMRGIEFSFIEPLDFKHPVTGDPLLYSGRFDQIVDFCGQRFGEDDKTTTSLGPSWSRSWDLRSQFTAYCWGAQRANIQLEGFLVRGISILKTKYDRAEAITYRRPWQIEQWYEQLIERDLPAMVRMWESGKWGMSLDHACADYGGCPFRQVCLSEPAKRREWLEVGFQRREWNPVTRVETVLEG
jgi:hypothetical protein